MINRICIMLAYHILMVLMTLFYFKHYFLKFCNSSFADFENLHYLVPLNDSMNDTLVDSNSGKEIIILDIICFYGENVLDKQS